MNMPDLKGMLTKPILLPKGSGSSPFDASFPLVKNNEKQPTPREKKGATAAFVIKKPASAHDLLYKMESMKVKLIIRAFRRYKLHKFLKLSIATRKVRERILK